MQLQGSCSIFCFENEQKLFLNYCDCVLFHSGYFVFSVVANLPDVIGVRVAEEKVNYFGNTHQVVLVMSTGMSLGITESFTFGTTK